jgi:hypothetical protein
MSGWVSKLDWIISSIRVSIPIEGIIGVWNYCIRLDKPSIRGVEPASVVVIQPKTGLVTLTSKYSPI